MMLRAALFMLFVITAAEAVDHESVPITEVQVLTLHRNKRTAGRRAPPVPHLKCMGGSAAKSHYHPEVVQCYNRGSDGQDVQWECKADLDKAVRFGKINVYCEGFHYPDDPNILKGSCGLEYHLEYVDGYKESYKAKDSDTAAGGLIIFVIVCVVVWFVYASCIRSNGRTDSGQSRFRGGGPPYDGPPPPYDDRPSAPPGDTPPPYGFRPDHFQQKQGASGAGFQQQEYRQQRHNPNANAPGQDGPGFWTGLGAGGLLGYMFGNRGSAGHQYGYSQPGYARTYPSYRHDDSSGFFGGSTTSTQSGESSGTGTRSASGFGGTRRR